MNKQFKAVIKAGLATLAFAASAPVLAVPALPSSSSDVGYYLIEAGATHPVNHYRDSGAMGRAARVTAAQTAMPDSFLPKAGNGNGIDG